MSKQENNETNKKLKEFLENRETPMDDFEREAMEGFAMLENQEEAMELKENLDKKIYSEVFSEKKRSPIAIGPVAYWFAAAGFLLVVGLSVIFVMNRPAQKDLAVNQDIATETIEEKAVKQSLKDAETLRSASASQPSEGKFEPAKTAPTVTGPEKKEFKNIAGEKGYSAGNGQSGTFRDEDMKLAEAEADNAPEIAAAVPSSPAEPGVKMNAAPKMAAGNTTSINAADANYKDAAGEGDKVSKEDAKKVAVQEYDMAKNKAEKEKATEEIVAVEAKHKSRSAKFARKKAEQAPADTRYDDVSDEVKPAATGTTSYRNAFYKTGADGLAKDLKEKLAAKNLDKKFDATLFISNEKKIEKAVIDRSFSLTEKEKNEVIEILKTLNKFELTNTEGTSGLLEYKINYRP